MTDTQFGILIAAITAGLGTLSGVIKWSVGVLTRSLEANTNAHLESVKAMTAMSTKLDFVYQATGKVDNFIREEISNVTNMNGVEDDTPVDIPKRRTPTRYFVRPKTIPGEQKK